MTPKEGLEVLETIAELYPKFEVTKRKVRILLPQFEQMDFEGVMNNLSNHVATYAYPPTIAEIAAYLPEPNKHLEDLKKWEEEAAKVPKEVKDCFKAELAKLVEEKSKS
ncbi:hypothetical protein [Oceanobacillus bengalensis]|uniref:Replicative helicase inhibitor G39P N-terminal domain-containing protein n=1 Tax=Oceanobacillus bengalensis TaxID=1435466 RepID=A0A494Z3I7_9BACI|nr:hypothetical protein [Oceanobacillus bengalensis]RKQ17070.1 hypothetical protein D8M05_05205 [Oceanobacillus bengalensis]